MKIDYAHFNKTGLNVTGFSTSFARNLRRLNWLFAVSIFLSGESDFSQTKYSTELYAKNPDSDRENGSSTRQTMIDYSRDLVSTRKV